MASGLAASRLDLLDPADVAALGGIEVVARGVVEGFLSGLHRSPFRGFSVEFAEHRPYQPGDELRYLDWKILGKRDRLYVKQYEEETNLRATLVLDISRSMHWKGSAERGLTKLDYATRLAAALALVLLRQRDATGLIAFDDAVRSVVPPRARSGQWHQVVRALMALEPGGGTAAEPALRRVTDLLRRRGMVIFVSDLLVERDLVLTALRYLRHRGHQVTVFHIMDPAEIELLGPAEARYVDPESGDSVVASAAALRREYRATVDRVVAAWRRACRSSGIAYHRVTTETPFGQALRRASEGRSRLG
ncbi:MAG: hypothetical protein A2083_08410 [Gemmatimonadetes bacterium GWC2_71_9]|nr:MAG: hypothetical protein A2083_08410 [Gemmatimonadetes bacterium GWC2_71_9]OGT96413.1 MAG: hypothetical protein A3I79_07110 [Gemmatimonadetes bacterium RIFCSPLOWO2_02_FULL_71_11]